MPSVAPAADVRVRTPVSLPGQLRQLDHAEQSKQQPSQNTASTAAPTAQRQQPQQSSSNGTITYTNTTSSNTNAYTISRPALNRNVASHTSFGSGGTDGSTYLQSDDGSAGVPDFGDTIDSTTFEQILEMDDDEEEREFSKSIVYDFFTQADGTFQKMDKALTDRDLNQLSQLGHFLKGSSATLGLTKVKDSCEKIQHFGAKKDETGTDDVADENLCLQRLKEEIKVTKREFAVVEVQLKKFYRDEGS